MFDDVLSLLCVCWCCCCCFLETIGSFPDFFVQIDWRNKTEKVSSVSAIVSIGYQMHRIEMIWYDVRKLLKPKIIWKFARWQENWKSTEQTISFFLIWINSEIADIFFVLAGTNASFFFLFCACDWLFVCVLKQSCNISLNFGK